MSDAPARSVECSPADFAGLSEELLRAGRVVRFRARGASMTPLIRDGDVLLVHPVDPASIRLGDLVLFRAGTDRVLVHRVTRRTGGREDTHFTIQGDQVAQPDGVVAGAEILGKVTVIDRSGKLIGVGSASLRLLGLAAALRSRWNLRRGRPYRLAAGVLRKLPAFSRHLA